MNSYIAKILTAFVALMLAVQVSYGYREQADKDSLTIGGGCYGHPISPACSLKVFDFELNGVNTNTWLQKASYGYIALRLNPLKPYAAGLEVEVKVNVKVEYINYPATASQLQYMPDLNGTLSLKVNTLTGTQMKNLDMLPITNLRAIKSITTVIKSVDISKIGGGTVSTNDAWQVYNNLVLSNTLEAERYDALNIATAPTNIQAIATGSAQNKEIELSWLKVDGAEAYELEYTYVDDYSVNNLTDAIATTQLDVNFRFDATRVRIEAPATKYILPMLYDRGYLVYRVRAIGRSWDPATLVENTAYTVWSVEDGDKKLSDISGSFTSITSLYTPQNINYQNVSDFAEEAKRKDVVTYYDDNYRKRQIQATDRTTGKEENIVTEQYYDAIGRQVLDIIPAPVDPANATVNRLWYQNYNKLNGSGAPSLQASDLETGSGCGIVAPDLSTTIGSSKYFSPSTHATGLHTAYIPDAELKPYVLTQYTPDNTGRVNLTTAPGAGLSLNKPTRYLYATPEQEEINRLFGTNAGLAAHYKKQAVIDPNSQVSISITDMFGRTVATSLEGAVPNGVQSLSSTQTATYGAVLLDGTCTNPLEASCLSTQNKREGDALVVSKTFMITTDDTDVTFKYDFSPAPAFQWSCRTAQETVCMDCIYDVEISLRNECGDIVQYDAGSGQMTDFLFTKYGVSGSVSTEPADNNCATDLDCATNCPKDKAYLFDGGTLIASLNVGTYTLVKTLKINKEKLDEYLNKYKESCPIDLTVQDGYSDVTTDLLNLGNSCDPEPSCEECVEALGKTYCDYLEKNTDLPDNSTTRTQYEAEREGCLSACKTPSLCDIAYKMMLTDVSPGGQYFKYGQGLSAADWYLSLYNTDGNLLPADKRYMREIIGIGYCDDCTENTPFGGANWHNPAEEYTNPDGTLALIPVTDNGDGTTTPASLGDGVRTVFCHGQTDFEKKVVLDAYIDAEGLVRYCDGTVNCISNNDGTANVNGEDRTMVKAVRPRDLANFEDFEKYFRKSWAKALVKFHPEYCYYESCLENKTEINMGNGKEYSSEEYDARLFLLTELNQALHNYDTPCGNSEYCPIDNTGGSGSGGTETTTCDSEPFYDPEFVGRPLINDITANYYLLDNDPFFAAGGLANTYYGRMKYTLENYKCVNASAACGSAPYCLSLKQMTAYLSRSAYLYHVNVLDALICPSSITNTEITDLISTGKLNFGNNFYDEALYSSGAELEKYKKLNEEIKNKEWLLYVSMYMGEKQKILREISDAACKNNCDCNGGYNGCIGNPSFAGLGNSTLLQMYQSILLNTFLVSAVTNTSIDLTGINAAFEQSGLECITGTTCSSVCVLQTTGNPHQNIIDYWNCYWTRLNCLMQHSRNVGNKYQFAQPCGETARFYVNKIKRFADPEDGLINSTALCSTGDALADLQKAKDNGDLDYYLQTGQDPITRDTEGLLRAMASKGNIANDAIGTELDIFNWNEFTNNLYDQIRYDQIKPLADICNQDFTRVTIARATPDVTNYECGTYNSQLVCNSTPAQIRYEFKRHCESNSTCHVPDDGCGSQKSSTDYFIQLLLTGDDKYNNYADDEITLTGFSGQALNIEEENNTKYDYRYQLADISDVFHLGAKSDDASQQRFTAIAIFSIYKKLTTASASEYKLDNTQKVRVYGITNLPLNQMNYTGRCLPSQLAKDIHKLTNDIISNNQTGATSEPFTADNDDLLTSDIKKLFPAGTSTWTYSYLISTTTNEIIISNGTTQLSIEFNGTGTDPLQALSCLQPEIGNDGSPAFSVTGVRLGNTGFIYDGGVLNIQFPATNSPAKYEALYACGKPSAKECETQPYLNPPLITTFLNDLVNTGLTTDNGTVVGNNVFTASNTNGFDPNTVGTVYASNLAPQIITDIEPCGTEATIGISTLSINEFDRVDDKLTISIQPYTLDAGTCDKELGSPCKIILELPYGNGNVPIIGFDDITKFSDLRADYSNGDLEPTSFTVKVHYLDAGIEQTITLKGSSCFKVANCTPQCVGGLKQNMVVNGDFTMTKSVENSQNSNLSTIISSGNAFYTNTFETEFCPYLSENNNTEFPYTIQSATTWCDEFAGGEFCNSGRVALVTDAADVKFIVERCNENNNAIVPRYGIVTDQTGTADSKFLLYSVSPNMSSVESILYSNRNKIQVESGKTYEFSCNLGAINNFYNFPDQNASFFCNDAYAGCNSNAGDLLNINECDEEIDGQTQCFGCSKKYTISLTIVPSSGFPVFELIEVYNGFIRLSDGTIIADNYSAVNWFKVKTTYTPTENDEIKLYVVYQSASNPCAEQGIPYSNHLALDDISFAEKCEQRVLSNYVVPEPNCEDDAANILAQFVDNELDEQWFTVLANVKQKYIDHCLGTATKENLEYNYQAAKGHYTLYHYDQSGNLKSTVPPAGVEYSTAANIAIDNARINGNTAGVPNHQLRTTYLYNTLGQVVSQNTPDAGTSKFWYDPLGRIVYSQNAKQNAPTDAKRYSYTRYDALGRVYEVGELTSYNSLLRTANGGRLTDADINAIYTAAIATRTDITTTWYDRPMPGGITLTQENLRNRVAAVTYSNIPAVYTHATYYSYDIHGNVKTLYQELPQMATFGAPSLKRVDYEYDLISGKVLKVWYQKGQLDQYAHRYTYDAENRITAAYTSTDGLHWDRDAAYSYYPHGPLARTETGNMQVQGTDYAYTLQGWLKAINGNKAGVNDIGEDGITNTQLPKDLVSVQLDYFAGTSTTSSDYKAVGSAAPAIIPNVATANSLYNGNISAMTTTIPTTLGTVPQNWETRTNTYRYDQLNRLVKVNEGNGPNDETFSYDANGNITTLTRNDQQAARYDDLTYHYYTGTNKLEYVSDAATASNNTDIDNQATANYLYDEIGNLTHDYSERIATISWNPYGKITSVIKDRTRMGVSGTNDNSFYAYDGMGNRVLKYTGEPDPQTGLVPEKNRTYTWYVRDAQGNVLSTYHTALNQTGKKLELYQDELHLYGSSRVGLVKLNKNRKLGDKCVQNCNGGGNGNGGGGNSNAPVANTNLVITEILYNGPVQNANGSESHTGEYITIRNMGSENAALQGHYLLDATTNRRHNLPATATLAPGQTMLIAWGSRADAALLQAADKVPLTVLMSAGVLTDWQQNMPLPDNGGEVQLHGPGILIDRFPYGTAGYEVSTEKRLLSEINDPTRPAPGSLKRLEYNPLINGTTPSPEQVAKGPAQPVVGPNRNYTTATATPVPHYYGNKLYEYTNHLGNVLAVSSDYKAAIDTDNDGTANYYAADVVSSSDYYAFGSLMTGRNYSSNSYRYGFNGKENDNEVKGTGNQQDYGMRIYDPRLGRFLSVDPLTKEYPWNSTYSFAENDVIRCIDLDGAERLVRIHGYIDGKVQTVVYNDAKVIAKLVNYMEKMITSGNAEFVEHLQSESSTYTGFRDFWSGRSEGTLSVYQDQKTGKLSYNYYLESDKPSKLSNAELEKLRRQFYVETAADVLDKSGNAFVAGAATMSADKRMLAVAGVMYSIGFALKLSSDLIKDGNLAYEGISENNNNKMAQAASNVGVNIGLHFLGGKLAPKDATNYVLKSAGLEATGDYIESQTENVVNNIVPPLKDEH